MFTSVLAKVMESKTTSKTSSLTALLLKAWRERWTDLQWGINIKTVLPRGVSGDVYNLADCILQQAVVGTGANQLVLSYLRHSLSAQLVSHAAVLQRLSKYNLFSKVFCVLSLLEFLEGMIAGVTCCGKNEEINLATAILSISCWLLSILLHNEGPTNADVRQKASYLFKTLMNDDFYVSMMCLARFSDPELFSETNQKCVELSATLQESDDELLKSVKKLETIEVTTLSLPVSTEAWPGSLIQYWMGVKLIGNPGATTSDIASQLRLFQNLKGFDESRLYAETIRGSLLTLHDANETTHESEWGAFAFLKVPCVLLELSGKTDSEHIVTAIELLLQHSPLLDAMDAKGTCSSLECLLEEFSKIRLINEMQVKDLLEKRQMPPPCLKLDKGLAIPGIPKVISCTEPTLVGILKTLTTDYQKIQEALLGMLHQILTGKSFELILAVATVKNQLKILVARLIRFNELSKNDRARAQLFDITFLMLVAIVQRYGVGTVLDTDGDSMFEQWVRCCMVERLKPKPPEQFLRMGDTATIEGLITQFNAGDDDFKASIKWQDAIFNMAGVMHEVLVAWEQGTLAACDVKRILDAVRGRMCCLPLAAAAWLCAYMRTAPQENLLKPINMVQQLLTPPTAEDDYLKDRWQLTCEIIKGMQEDVQFPLQTKSSHHLISRQPAIEQLHSLWTCAIQKGWLGFEATTTLHCLLTTAGARWLVSATVQELVKLRYPDHLQRGVDLALAVFHVNIVSCTLELLSHIYQMLYNDIKAWQLEPQLMALAKLTSCCIYTAVDSCRLNDNDDGNVEESVVKRPRIENANEGTIEQLVSSLRKLLTIFEEIVREGYITQQTYFAFYLIKSLVEVRVNGGNTVLAAIPPALITDLLKTLPELFSYSMLIRLHDVFNVHGRSNMAKDLCILRNYKLKKNIAKENVSM